MTDALALMMRLGWTPVQIDAAPAHVIAWLVMVCRDNG